MGRGKGKARRQSKAGDRDDTASGEDEKLPVRRRGRPLKPIKGDTEEADKTLKIEKEEEIEEPKDTRKRNKPSQVSENDDLENNENGVGTTTELAKPVGYRQNTSRRKNKPRRAAEVGVECN